MTTKTTHTHDPARPCLACCYYPCAHCQRDIGGIIKSRRVVPDTAGSCPTCRGELCSRCAGGWCDGPRVDEHRAPLSSTFALRLPRTVR